MKIKINNLLKNDKNGEKLENLNEKKGEGMSEYENCIINYNENDK